MTMQAKIWATHFTGSRTEGKFSIYNLNAYGPHTEYIRADIAEELAGSVRRAMHLNMTGMRGAADALLKMAMDQYEDATK